MYLKYGILKPSSYQRNPFKKCYKHESKEGKFMLHSIVLMFSQYNKNRKISNIFKVSWILYATAAAFFNSNPWFSLVNASVFMLVTGFVYYISKVCPKINAFLSVGSILIYSLFVDIVCYYALPNWSVGQSLASYVMSGFLFNYKYVFLNVAVFGVLILCSIIYVDLCQYFGQKKLKGYTNFLSSASSFCCGVI